MPDSAIHIIAEPGRFFVSSAFTLICKIYSKREIVQNDKLEKTMYFINDGVYGSFNCILYDHRLAAPTYITVLSWKSACKKNVEYLFLSFLESW